MEIDQEIEELEKELQDMDSNKNSNYGFPDSPSKDSVFKFFREILNSSDSTKTGNLKDNELGIPKVPVRSLLNIGLYAESEGLTKVADYLYDKAEIISATSMSRKGFLSQLFVTQIKQEKKVRDTPEKKEGWFKNKFKSSGDTE